MVVSWIMRMVKPANTLLVKKNDNLFDQTMSTYDAPNYRRIIGGLLCLVNTRPDISFVVQFLSQFVQTPSRLMENVLLHHDLP